MRALYLPHLSPRQVDLEIEGEDFTHLVHVTRIEVGENVKIIYGEGKSAMAQVQEIKKRSLILALGDLKQEARPYMAKAFVGTVKKEAMAEVIRLATELMISELYFLETEYSQRLEMSADRVEKLLKSAVEQSNNLYAPKVVMGLKWADLMQKLAEEKYVYFMHKGQSTNIDENKGSKVAVFSLLVGPEGGFSAKEVEDLLACSSRPIDLPTAILRTPSAVAAGMGWILSQNCH